MGPRQTPGRLLAPLSLAAVFVVAVVVLATSLSGGGGGEGDRVVPPPPSSSPAAGETPQSRSDGEGDSYVVKPGDNLVGISAKTGLSVESLQSLNPNLDPQALVSGQRLRLRR